MADEVDIENAESERDGMDLEPEEPEEEATEAPGLVYDEDSENLVRDMMAAGEEGERFLKKASATVIRNFQAAWDAAEEYRERFKKEWCLFSGELPQKDWPWKDAANLNIPIMLENMSRLVARAEGELFGDWRNVFGVESISIDPIDRQMAETLNAHGNWQLREQIPDFKRQLGQRGLLAYFWIGDVTSHSYYNPERQMNRHEILTPEEFVVPYSLTTTMPDYSDCPWICKIVNYQRHELEARRGEWFDVDAVLEGSNPSWDDEPEQSIQEEVARVQGVEPVEDDDGDLTQAAPYKVLWYEGWMKLPGQERDRYIQALVHQKSRAILKLTIHEEEDWQDKQRYLQQEEELRLYRESVLQHTMQVEQLAQMQESFVQSSQAGLASPELTMQAMQQVQQQMPPVPIPPHWMKDPNDLMEGPEPPRRVPLYMFGHGVCIENFVGAYGLSYGRIEADLNRAANVMTNQFVDAGTLANVRSFLVTDGVDFGTFKPLRPGTVNRVKGIVGPDLKSNIMPLDFGPANSQLMEMVDRIQGWARTAMQAPEVLSGEPGKSGETFRGISVRIEQATKQLSVYVQHYAQTPLEIVLKNNARLNAKFLKDEEVIQIATSRNGGKQPFTVRRDMYDRNYKASISSDLRFATQAQRIQEADEAAGLAGKVPQLMQSPDFMKAVVVNQYRARGMNELLPLVEKAFQPPPAPPPGPPGAPPGMPPGGGGPPPGMPP